MRRLDRLLDSYVEDYRAMLGVSPQSVAYTEARLHRRGRWLKGRHHETPATVFCVWLLPTLITTPLSWQRSDLLFS